MGGEGELRDPPAQILGKTQGPRIVPTPWGGGGGLLHSHPTTQPATKAVHNTQAGGAPEREGRRGTYRFLLLRCTLLLLSWTPWVPRRPLLPPLMGRNETCLPRHPAIRQHQFKNELRGRDPSAPIHQETSNPQGGVFGQPPTQNFQNTPPPRPVGQTLSTSLIQPYRSTYLLNMLC